MLERHLSFRDRDATTPFFIPRCLITGAVNPIGISTSLRVPLRFDSNFQWQVTHQPLPKTGHPIRLLTLLPVDILENQLRSSINTVDLDDEPDYRALFYCWENSTQDTLITLNDSSFYITTSLSVALRNLRRHVGGQKGVIVIWADALCINQCDMTERSSQVQMMGHIFSQARQVVLWPGNGADDSSLAMDLMYAMGSGHITTNEYKSWTSFPEFLTDRAWKALRNWSERDA